MKAESFSKCSCYKSLHLYSWPALETRVLITIWSQEHVQDELKRVHRNHDIFQRMSKELEDCGFPRTRQQCQARIKNLTAKYRKVRSMPN